MRRICCYINSHQVSLLGIIMTIYMTLCSKYAVKKPPCGLEHDAESTVACLLAIEKNILSSKTGHSTQFCLLLL